jgi:hypothetical protein
MDQNPRENGSPETARLENDDRQPYETPVLADHGTVADLTQGTFAGVGADNGIYS